MNASSLSLRIDLYINVVSTAFGIDGSWEAQNRFDWEDIDNVTWEEWTSSLNLSAGEAVEPYKFWEEITEANWEDIDDINWENMKYYTGE